MTEGGFYQQKRLSPTGVTVVVLLHGAALIALMTAKGEYFPTKKDPPTIVRFLKDPPPPPKIPPEPTKARSHTPDDIRLTSRPIPIPLPPLPGPAANPGPLSWPINDGPTGPISELPPPPPPPPVHEPVRTPAQIDSRSALQPPYPASAQREEAEGFVEVRVAIGADGRVKAVEKVRASREDFFAATERQALRYWRFKPALLDGKPIESSKVMSVRFKLNEGQG
jgi:protein TonB